jgi:hypothetical protein
VLRARRRAAERQAEVSRTTADRRAALVQEILAGRPPRRLPDAVEAALSVLAA